MINAELEQLLTTLPPGSHTDPPDAFQAVECRDLDGQHRHWLNNYLAYCRSSLQQEVDQAIPDLVMVGFFRRELLKYHELLARL